MIFRVSLVCSSLLATGVFSSGCSGAIHPPWHWDRAHLSADLEGHNAADRDALARAVAFDPAADRALTSSVPGMRRIPLGDGIPEVDRFVDYYLSEGSLYFRDGYDRRQKYHGMLVGILASYGLPPELVNVPFVESRYITDARSPSGAVGMWQFMRPTAEGVGLRVSFFVDERRNVVKATHAAAEYLSYLYDVFGNWHLALAAYNGGINRVREAIHDAGTRDFFELARRGYFPKETRDYVPKFLALSRLCRALESPRRASPTMVLTRVERK